LVWCIVMHESSRSIAYHEAGHAVAACLAGKRFTVVTIVPTDDALGYLAPKRWKNFRPDFQTDRRAIQRMKGDIFISLAGPAAEAILTRRKRMPGSHKDFYHSMEMASRLCGSDKETNAYISFMWEQTWNIMILRHNWEAVKVVAKSLLRKRTLRYRAVRWLVRESFRTDAILKIDLL